MSSLADNPEVYWNLYDPVEVKLPSGQSLHYEVFVKSLAKDMKSETLNLLHGAVGVSGEAGELLDAVKKLWAYEKPYTQEVHANILEELGDIEFYLQVVRTVAGIYRQEVLQANVNKLAVRYANLSYSNEAALTRADKAITGETASSGLGDSLETGEADAQDPPNLVNGKVVAINTGDSNDA